MEEKFNKIKNKVYNEGIDTLTQEELVFIENRFIIELTGKYFEPSLRKIISEYYTKNNNLDKIIYFSNYAFENKHERDCNSIFGDYMYEHKTEEDIKKYEELDYPFVHKCLGEKYYNEENIDKALEHFKKGAEQKSFFCAKYIFNYYTRGNLGYNFGISERLENIDFEKAVYYADLLANSVELTDSFNIDLSDLNYYLFEPLEKTNNLTETEKNKIMSKIMNSKGLLYYKSLIYAREGNLDMFLYYCELSASKGYYKANEKLANMYLEGQGVKQDYKKAIKYFEAAAEKGNLSALNNLGCMYLEGLGEKQDYKKAIEYFEAAAEKGNESPKEYIMRYKYINNEQISYNELFELEKNNHQNDEYFENIKKQIEKGSKVIVVENIKDLTLEQLNGMPNDTIINIKYDKDIKTSCCKDFYTCSDMKKIIKVCNKILEDIDLNQREEDIFMQIYIKLGKMISYDYDAIKKHEEEKESTSRNLMVLLSKKGVCVGYAEALKCLLNMAGIECNVLSSKADKKNTSHAYNQVKLNGKWYYCDLTWDSDKIKLGTIHYCLKSKKYFEKCLSSIYHTTSNTSQEYEANEDYPNINSLFIKNNLKLLKKKLNTPLEQLIEPTSIKEDGGRTR